MLCYLVFWWLGEKWLWKVVKTESPCKTPCCCMITPRVTRVTQFALTVVSSNNCSYFYSIIYKSYYYYANLLNFHCFFQPGIWFHLTCFLIIYKATYVLAYYAPFIGKLILSKEQNKLHINHNNNLRRGFNNSIRPGKNWGRGHLLR